MTGFAPTDEQQAVVDAFVDGAALAVEAGAGTGKTSTLELLGRATQRTGVYVAFNLSIVQAAGQRMPMNVQCSTAHSLAMRAVGGRYRHRLEQPRMKPWTLAKRLGVPTLNVQLPDGRWKVLQPSYLAGLTLRAVRTFCATADAEPGPEHVPYIEGIDAREGAARGWRNNAAVREELAGPIKLAWADLVDPAGDLPFTHDHYFKVWQLGDPVIPGEFILFDEAQDASPVMLDVVQRQVDRGSQVVFVGDSQQQIYGWRGAVNALAHVPADRRLFLSRSFRFGPPIAEVANLLLSRLGSPLRLTGSDTVQSRVTACPSPKAILCRTNAQSIAAVLNLQKQGKAVHLVGGGDEVVRFAAAAIDLQAGRSTSHPDLACFDTWAEVQAYVKDDPMGDELALMVRLLDEYGPQIVLDALQGMLGEDAAEYVVSTAHKAKGREWSTVRLASDFQDPDEWGDAGLEEWRLLYVAATRAQHVLDPRFCAPIAELLKRRVSA